MLPPEQHAEVIAEMRAQIAGFACACGALKPPGNPFCADCARAVERIDMDRWIFTLRSCVNPQHVNRDYLARMFSEHYWKTYDRLCDFTLAVKQGRWDFKPVRRERDA